jgi:hypothetical protein
MRTGRCAPDFNSPLVEIPRCANGINSTALLKQVKLLAGSYSQAAKTHQTVTL